MDDNVPAAMHDLLMAMHDAHIYGTGFVKIMRTRDGLVYERLDPQTEQMDAHPHPTNEEGHNH